MSRNRDEMRHSGPGGLRGHLEEPREHGKECDAVPHPFEKSWPLTMKPERSGVEQAVLQGSSLKLL